VISVQDEAMVRTSVSATYNTASFIYLSAIGRVNTMYITRQLTNHNLIFSPIAGPVLVYKVRIALIF
jgi:hypothetical protein